MFPVLEFPRVKFWKLVVPRTPLPFNVVALAPLLAEMEAVGVPEFTLMNANLALLVPVAPRSRSSVVFLSKIDPEPMSNGDPPLVTGSIPDT